MFYNIIKASCDFIITNLIDLELQSKSFRSYIDVLKMKMKKNIKNVFDNEKRVFLTILIFNRLKMI